MQRLLTAGIFTLAVSSTAHAADSGTVLYRGATFVTLDAAVPRAQAVLVSAGRIKRVFATDPGAAFPGARVVDLHGGVVVPGLHDAHVHLAGLGNVGTTLDVTGTHSAAEVVERLRAWMEDHPSTFVVGRGWDQNDWACDKAKTQPCGGQMPTRALLDAVAPDVPVMLRRVDGHAAWVNGAALALATEKGARALAKGGADPQGGKILRGKDGEPTGVLVDEAMTLVDAHIPAPTPEELQARLRAGAEAASAAGLTCVHDMGMSLAELEALRALDRAGELPLRVFVYLDGAEKGVLDALPTGGARRAEGRVEVRGVKLYADGALGSRGAALLQPYSDEPTSKGLLVTEPKLLEERARAVHQKGFQLAIHAIGDRANREVLQLYGRLGKDAASRRHRVEHAQVVDVKDWQGFKATGAVASMQPTHATSDMPWAQARLGKARLEGAYAWKSLQKKGAVLAFGSDAPVENIAPLWGLYAAVTRQDHAGAPAGGWTPGERLSSEEALTAFTRGAAYAVHREDELGVITEGALADFTHLDRDPTLVPAAELLETKILGRFIDGVRLEAP
jgi:predicted amidohydrolase YtcJ